MNVLKSMEIRFGHSEMSVIMQVSTIEGCSYPLYTRNIGYLVLRAMVRALLTCSKQWSERLMYFASANKVPPTPVLLTLSDLNVKVYGNNKIYVHSAEPLCQ